MEEALQHAGWWDPLVGAVVLPAKPGVVLPLRFLYRGIDSSLKNFCDEFMTILRLS
jgi:hypothetical protein